MNDDPIVAAAREIADVYQERGATDAMMYGPVRRLDRAMIDAGLIDEEARPLEGSIWPWRSPDAPPDLQQEAVVLARRSGGEDALICERTVDHRDVPCWWARNGQVVYDRDVIGWLPMPADEVLAARRQPS